jgi:hypothetical protein
VTLPVASAQGAASYGLGAKIGDWATYKIDQFSYSGTAYSGLILPLMRAGDTVRFTVVSLGNCSIYDKNNRVAVSWVVPITLCTLNDTFPVQFLGYFSSAIYLERYGVNGVNYGYVLGLLLSFPFFPKGEDFWRAIEPYAPDLQMNFTQNMVSLTCSVYDHYSTSSEGATNETCFNFDLRAQINEVTGVLSTYRDSCNYSEYQGWGPSEYFNGSWAGSFGMTLIDTNVSSAIQSGVDPVVVVSISSAPVVAIFLIAFFSSRRRARFGGMTKTEILGRLNSEDLIRLARAVPGIQINRDVDRSELIRIIKQHLSLQEIRGRLKSG